MTTPNPTGCCGAGSPYMAVWTHPTFQLYDENATLIADVVAPPDATSAFDVVPTIGPDRRTLTHARFGNEFRWLMYGVDGTEAWRSAGYTNTSTDRGARQAATNNAWVADSANAQLLAAANGALVGETLSFPPSVVGLAADPAGNLYRSSYRTPSPSWIDKWDSTVSALLGRYDNPFAPGTSLEWRNLLVAQTGRVFAREKSGSATRLYIVAFDAALTSRSGGWRGSSYSSIGMQPFVMATAEDYIGQKFDTVDPGPQPLARYTGLSLTPTTVWQKSTNDWTVPAYDREAHRLWAYHVPTSSIVELDPDTGADISSGNWPLAISSFGNWIDVYPGRDAPFAT